MKMLSRFIPFVSSFLVIIFSSTLHSSFAQESTTDTSTTSNDTTTTTTTTPSQPHKVFQVYHSMGQNKPFVPRGKVLFTILEEDNKVVSTTIEHNEDCLGVNALEDMDALIQEGGFYRIKIVEEGNESRSVMASVPACEVRRANFREEIALSMSQTGSLQSISYTPLVSPLAAECHELQPLSSISDREYKFQTLLSYTTSTPGMTLPKVLPKMRPYRGLDAIKIKKTSGSNNSGSSTNNNNNDSNNDNGQSNTDGSHRFHAEEDDEKKKEEANQSFFRKYWYIILPLSIMTFFTSDEETTKRMEQMQQQQQGQQQQQQGQQQRGGSGNATAAGNVSSGSGSGSAPRQRRGKRG